MSYLDSKRRADLSHPMEGIVFVSHEISGHARQSFDLHAFPYDFQELCIPVRLVKRPDDALLRHLVPLAHDKAFFCSGRVPPLTEWNISKNLDWTLIPEEGTRGRDGGKEKLTAKIIICRKSTYYTTHYVLIIFAMTTTVFCTFTIDAGSGVPARVGIVFMLILTLVTFQYTYASLVPKTSYSTCLDEYLQNSIYFVYAVGLCVGTSCFLAVWDERRGFLKEDDGYPLASGTNYPKHSAEKSLFREETELSVACTLFAGWIGWNCFYWREVFSLTRETKRMIEQDEQLGWLQFHKGGGGGQGVTSRQLVPPEHPPTGIRGFLGL